MSIVMLLLALSATPGAQPDRPWRTGVSPRITALAQEVQSGNTAAVVEFWRELRGRHAPLTEAIPGDAQHRLVTFVYRGTLETRTVVLYCQMMEGRDPGTNVLSRLAQTDVWFKTYAVRTDLRLSYSFMPDPTTHDLSSPNAGLADPLNPIAAPVAPFMGHSVLELPDAPAQPWVAPRLGVRAGSLAEVRVHSTILKSERVARIYTPADYDRARPASYPLVLCFDGDAYASPDYMPMPTIIDNLIADEKIPPIVMVLVGQAPPPARNIELSNNEPFLRFVTDELLPRVRATWHVTADPGQTIVTGSSAGGLAAAFFGFRRPDVFGNVLSQSGAFWPGKERADSDHEWLTGQFETSETRPVRFVLQVGLLERGPTPGDGPSILDTNRHLRTVLMKKGYDVHYRETSSGHEPLSWRGEIAEGLMHLLGAVPSSQERPVDAVRGIVAAFQAHPVVVIGEWRHGLRQMGDFYIRLVKDPAFQKVAPDIVIEFASRQNQSLLDRYVAGENLPPDDVRHIWRDTTKVASWEFPIYAQWLAAIRDVNRARPPAQRFRVLAGDTEVDWSRIHTHADWVRLGDNNPSFAEVIVQQVLMKHRRALVVLGGNHVAKLGHAGDPNTSTIVESQFPGSLYVVMHHLIPNDPNETVLQLPGRPQAAALYDVAGTALGRTPDSNGVSPERYLDAWLYVGPAGTMTEAWPPEGSLESTYMTEVDRRSMIEWGELRARRFLGAAAAR